jgi:hypothetical protein
VGIHFRVCEVISYEDGFKVRRDSDRLRSAILSAEMRLAAEGVFLVPTIGTLVVERYFDNAELVAWPSSFVREEESCVRSDSPPSRFEAYACTRNKRGSRTRS